MSSRAGYLSLNLRHKLSFISNKFRLKLLTPVREAFYSSIHIAKFPDAIDRSVGMVSNFIEQHGAQNRQRKNERIKSLALKASEQEQPSSRVDRANLQLPHLLRKKK
jgi:hypothetical protein